MIDELGKELIVESAKAVAKESYNDALKPALKAAGNIIALPFQVIDAALSKSKLWVAEKQYNYERTKMLLAEKLKDVPESDIIPPENYVAVPALQQISYCFDSDELREMYANLLAASMHKDKKWGIHPAFVEIIKQLTPDEAKLLKALPATLYNAHPLLEVRAMLHDSEGYNVLLSNYTDAADEVCDCPDNICAYIENLNRLKLIEVFNDAYITDDTVYESIQESQTVKNIISKKLSDDRHYDYGKGYFRLTSFGLTFVNMCILGL